ncbi:MAG: ATP-dependent DNA helicase RecG [Candidatus Kaiserbacteria bacterium]|nr:MAG: ATP-dependent DNA helicase RecG [Candidatus Kaiserbacteria bacterium]
MKPDDPLSQHFRLSPPQLSALRRLSLHTVGDLLRHFPTRYESAGTSVRVQNLIPGTKVTLFGTLSKLKAKKLWKSRRNITEGVFEDASGRVKVMWFNQPYIASYVQEGSAVKMTGTVGGKQDRPYIANPEIEHLPPGMVPLAGQAEGLFDEHKASESPSIFPVYPESRGITSRWFFHAIERVFASGVAAQIEDPVPAIVRQRYNLPDIGSALVWIHKPEKKTHAEAARKRFAFEEIFSIQVARARERRDNDSQPAFPIAEGAALAARFLDAQDVEPTGAQQRAIREILADFEKPHPMARLLEGDVGSGKTLVAAASAYAVVCSRPPGRTSGTLQVAYMAPTEILATQHFNSFIEYFSHLPINIALITGSGCKKFPSKISRSKATDISRAQLLKWVAGGEIAMLVGTHALIQKSVKFQHLAYAIVDEQHRFGTKQRRALARKGDSAPHFLSMTATPIPRTLALTLYGDLDLSILDELPPGRARITTHIVAPTEREIAYEKVREELRKGRQAYVICPRIEEPDPAKIGALQAKSAKAEAKRLQKDVFPEYAVGLLHGAMKKEEKENVMRQFDENKIRILVATSVVEVGINVPNATCILIEGAERFGLAQLHQLRGRVQRSSFSPYCFLLPESKGEASTKRLQALAESADGFKLAEADLEARGAGDLYGRQQWGVSDLGMEALKNLKLIRAAREEALLLIKSDPALAAHPALLARTASAEKDLHVE